MTVSTSAQSFFRVVAATVVYWFVALLVVFYVDLLVAGMGIDPVPFQMHIPAILLLCGAIALYIVKVLPALRRSAR